MCAEAFPVTEQAKADVFAGIDRKVGAKEAWRMRSVQKNGRTAFTRGPVRRAVWARTLAWQR
jgi:hypothetical protein